MKQALVSAGVALPFGPAWHRDLLQSACEHGIVSTGLREDFARLMIAPPNQSVQPTGGSRLAQSANERQRRLPPVADARRYTANA
jgi:hypothetical protein